MNQPVEDTPPKRKESKKISIALAIDTERGDNFIETIRQDNAEDMTSRDQASNDVSLALEESKQQIDLGAKSSILSEIERVRHSRNNSKNLPIIYKTSSQSLLVPSDSRNLNRKDY